MTESAHYVKQTCFIWYADGTWHLDGVTWVTL